MVFAIGCLACTCCADWICGLEVASEGQPVVQEVHTRAGAGAGNFAPRFG